MQYVISLCLVTITVLVADEVLRKRPLPFYVGAILLASLSVAFSWSGINIPDSVISKGTLAGAFFTLVMFAGVFPQGSFGAKTFMPVRAQLSIIGSVFALSHGLSLGKPYFLKLLSGIIGTSNAELDIATFISLVIAVSLMLIMLPLFVTSFKVIRKKMNPRRWKNLQRFAYLFCRILRAVYKNRKEVMVKMQITGVMVSLLLATVGTSYIMKLAAIQGKELVPDLPEVAGARKTNGYVDGTYHGTGMGNNGKIGVDVTISGGEIKEIRITDFPDDADYFDVDSDGGFMIQNMLESQSTDVDTVSGATYSSKGIIDAVNTALLEAVNK